MLIKLSFKNIYLLGRKEGDGYLIFDPVSSSALFIDSIMFVTLLDYFDGKNITKYQGYSELKSNLEKLNIII